MLKIAIVGYGYWGPVLLAKSYSLNPYLVKTVVDQREDRLKNVRKHYPHIITTTSIDSILEDDEIGAVIIATPAHSHFNLAKNALGAGKHVLVEKPITSSVREAEELIALSAQKKKVLMVDHTLLYTNAVQKMKSLIEKNELGKIRYFDATRISLGLFQPDVNVLWDLASHDLSILHYLIDDKPQYVHAIGVSHLENAIENMAYLTIRYRSGFIAHFNCSWSSPVKIRTILIGGDKKMILFNDIESTEKIKIYDKGYSIQSKEQQKNFLINYRVGDVNIPYIEINDAVSSMISDFIIAIEKKKTPISNNSIGLSVVKILEAAQRSLQEHKKIAL